MSHINSIEKLDFDVLNLMSSDCFESQRQASSVLNRSLGSINQSVDVLRSLGYIEDDYALSSAGKAAFDQFKVKNAIIMAAGMSSRFAPLSFENPKGLLKVKGEVLIERQIRQLQDAGIDDITIVLGYMKEKFLYLERKYNVKIVINDDYYRYNNTSTLMLVKDRISNTYICSSDNYFSENVFASHMYKATYPVVYQDESDSNEYYADFSKKGIISRVEVGSGHYCMLGQVYFDAEFSKTFLSILSKAYDDEATKHALWEKVYLDHQDELTLYAQEYPSTVIMEFDSLHELQRYDDYYLENVDSAIFKNIMRVLKCSVRDIQSIETIKAGMTNLSFKFTVFGKPYIYRHPGVGTETYINRESEAYAQEMAKELKLDDSFIAMNKEEGWKISHYIEDSAVLDYHNPDQVKQALTKIKILHDAQIAGKFEFNLWKKTMAFIEAIASKGRNDFADFDALHSLMERVYRLSESDGVPKVLCHCDFYDPNILISKGEMFLIDWEYAGVDDPASDIGTFIACSDYSEAEALEILTIYYGHQPTEEQTRHSLAYIALAAYYWFVWAIFQESNGSTVGEYLYIWYRCSYQYGEKALALYGGSHENH